MHIISSSVISLLGVAIVLVSGTFASSNIHQSASLSSASNYNHLNPSKSIMQIQRGDVHPVAYLQKRKLYSKFHRSSNNKLDHRKKKREARFERRDYATTLQFLKAAMESYKKDYVTPPPVQLVQTDPAAPIYLPAPSPPVVTEEIPPPDLESANPPLPDLSVGEPEPAPQVELGNELTESAPPPASADIEEDDVPDPEEDPDDVDDPPVVNGVAVPREE